MKTVLILGVLAASQCAAEPSGDSKPVSGADAGVESEDASVPDTSWISEVRAKHLTAGPEPFSVPTTRIAWPQLQATVLVPRGARLVGVGDSASVLLGEGANFHYRVTPVDSAALEPQVEARDDGARVWQEGHAWRFDVRTESFACTNDLPGALRHDLEDVEMMIASCRGIESKGNP